MKIKNFILTIIVLLILFSCSGGSINVISNRVTGPDLITLIPDVTKIEKEPESVSIGLGGSVQFSVEVISNYTNEKLYQWQRARITDPNNFINIDNTTVDNYFVIPSVTPEDAGSLYRVLISVKRKSDNQVTTLISKTVNITLQIITVSFDSNGGQGVIPAPITLNIGTQFTLPERIGITRVGYNFIGWGNQANSNSIVPNPYLPSNNTILYAVWDRTIP